VQRRWACQEGFELHLGRVQRRTGRETTTLPTSWSDLTMAAVSAGSSAPDTSTAWARLCSSM
jgi:hypothetical protein